MTAYIVTLNAWAVVEADTPEDAAEELARTVRHWEDYGVYAVVNVEPESAARERALRKETP